MTTNGYHYLEPRPGSSYRQWFIKDRRIRAEILYRQTLGEDARTPEQVAHDYSLPVEAVLEAIDYCQKYPEVLQADRDREWANIVKDGYDKAFVETVLREQHP
jgi:uncharacterized protein (DUF433 family)